MKTRKINHEASDLFVPFFSISLLHQKEKSISMRVFLSDAKSEKEALCEFNDLCRWKMDKYTLVQTIVANIKTPVNKL